MSTFRERMVLLEEVAAARKARDEGRARFVDALRAAYAGGCDAAGIAKHAGYSAEAGARMFLKREASKLRSA